MAAIATNTQASGTTSGTWVQWDVTGDVRNFVNLSQPNYGWTIKDHTESQSSTNYQATFRSKEYSGATYDPQIVVTYRP